MIILLVAFVSVVALFFLIYVVTARAIEIVSIAIFLAFATIIIATGGVGLVVGIISAAALYQLWGGSNIGWAIAASGLIGLATAWALLRAIINEIKSLSVRIKGWLGQDKIISQNSN